MPERRFPIQGETRPVWATGGPERRQMMQNFMPLTIPWAVAEMAYQSYSAWFGTEQSLERLAERGGFGREELLVLLAGDRDHYIGGGIESPPFYISAPSQRGRDA